MSGDDCLNIIGAGLAGCEIKSQKWINPPNETSHGAFFEKYHKKCLFNFVSSYEYKLWFISNNLCKKF